MMRYKDFADLIDRMAASFPTRPALLTCGNDGSKQAITWDELAQAVQTRTAELKNADGACEAILADGTPACVIEVFAAVRAGLQVALVDPLMPIERWNDMADVLDQKILTEKNGKRAKTAFKWFLIGFGALLAIDLISMLIYFIVNGFPG